MQRDSLVGISPAHSAPRAQALVSYLSGPASWGDEDSRFDGHSNKLKCKLISDALLARGIAVDTAGPVRRGIVKNKHYDIFFDAHSTLSAIDPKEFPKLKKILYVTGSFIEYNRQSELVRIESLTERRGGSYQPKRLGGDPSRAIQAMENADICGLSGNDFTLSTFPTKYHKKIHLLPVLGSKTFVKDASEYLNNPREFLWFFGSGAVHKGLDLVLEAFSRNRNLTLHVVGNAGKETDFVELYRKELFELPNIHYHGWLNPNRHAFRAIAERCFCFVAPSCAESTSVAVVTCLQLGLFPIISRDTGVSLRENCGIFLEECSIDEIEDAISRAYTLPDEELREQIATCQKDALATHDIDCFSERMDNFFDIALAENLG